VRISFGSYFNNKTFSPILREANFNQSTDSYPAHHLPTGGSHFTTEANISYLCLRYRRYNKGDMWSCLDKKLRSFVLPFKPTDAKPTKTSIIDTSWILVGYNVVIVEAGNWTALARPETDKGLEITVSGRLRCWSELEGTGREEKILYQFGICYYKFYYYLPLAL